jgi:hypothetical protein
MLLCLSCGAWAQQNYTIDTVAGSVPDRENEPAREAALVSPTASAVDAAGNFYFFDSSPARIRKVSPDGLIRTVGSESGTDLAVGPEGNIYSASGPYVFVLRPDGTRSIFAGNIVGRLEDGIPAAQARLRNVAGIATDSGGNVYISDSGNRLLWKVLPNGIIRIIRTVALAAPGRITISSTGQVYFIDGPRIRTLDGGVVAGSGESGLPQAGREATESPLGQLTDLAVNSKGQLYFVDGANRLIMRVGAEGKLEIVLDGGQNLSSEPPYVIISAIDFDPADNLMLVDTNGLCIRRLDETGTLSTAIGGMRSSGDGGSAREALLTHPVDVELDRDGSLIVVDKMANRLRRISPEGIITTFAGTGEYGSTGDGGPALEARLRWPSKVTTDRDGNIYFIDGLRIRRIGTDGVISTIAGGDEAVYSGDGGPATEARFVAIADLAVDSKGNIYISDQGASRIRRITPDGNIQTVAGTGELGRRDYPGDSPGVLVPVTPTRTTIDSDDSLLIYDPYLPAHELRRFMPDGTLVRAYLSSEGVVYDGIIHCQFQTVTAIVSSTAGIIASDGVQLCQFDRDGRSSFLGGLRGGFAGDDGSAQDAKFLGIQGLAVDSSGNIYVADTGNLRIRKLTLH